MLKLQVLILLTWFPMMSGYASSVLPPKDVPPHPFLTRHSSIHLDMYNSSVFDSDAPVGKNTKVKHHRIKSRLGVNNCLNFMGDQQGRLIAFCGTPRPWYLGGIEFHIALFDPTTMKKIDTYPFAKVSLLDLIRNDLPLNLGYFVMDHLNRAVIVNAKNEVHFISTDDNRLELDEQIKLPSSFQAAQVVPDHSGNYWLMDLGQYQSKRKDFRPAQLAYLNASSGGLKTFTFNNEVVENGLAMDHSGVYVVTDKAIYKLHYNTDLNSIQTSWVEFYERETIPKPGTISRYGSGTTPTLAKDDLVIITDNAPEQVNLLVYHRKDVVLVHRRLICKIPLFEKGKSANENSVVAYGNSIVVQNWYNAPKIMGNMKNLEPGVMRIDVREDRTGCDIIWYNREIATTSTIKLSTKTGLLYAPVQKNKKGRRESFEMAMVDFFTGRVVNRVYMGRGKGKRLIMAPVNIAEDGTLIQPILNGFITLKDSETP